ncbi:MAG TPA: hypothetical protein VJ501_10995 [Burkholderiaceae bacterium]|nr:hypothetical protein [Burkholderiaceae bacterium]
MKTLTRILPWSFAFLPRRSAGAGAVREHAAKPPGPHGGATLSGDESAAMNELRSSTLRAMFPLLFSRCARRSDLWQAVVIERYLSNASSLAELERRISTVKPPRQFSWSQ